jgi:hypothetical protein
VDFAIFGQNAQKCVTQTLFTFLLKRVKGCVIHGETRNIELYKNMDWDFGGRACKKFRGRLNAKNAHFGHFPPILGVTPSFFTLEKYFF